MPDEMKPPDPKAVWQNQPTEVNTITMRLLRSKARELQTRTRKQLMGTFTAPLVALFCYVSALRWFAALGPLLHALFVLSVAWSLVGFYVLRRGVRTSAMPPDAGLRTGLDFCRQELVHQSTLLSRALVWMFGPILAAIGTLFLTITLRGAGGSLNTNTLPFLILVVTWALVFFLLRIKQRRNIDYEIDELEDLEGTNGDAP